MSSTPRLYGTTYCTYKFYFKENEDSRLTAFHLRITGPKISIAFEKTRKENFVNTSLTSYFDSLVEKNILNSASCTEYIEICFFLFFTSSPLCTLFLKDSS